MSTDGSWPAPMRTISRFGPPLILMGVIFALSAQPDLNSGLGVWDTILRKLGHAAEYGLLWWLWWRAFGYRHTAAAVAITLAYAASDELHQSFVAGRHGSPLDWLIDATGVALAVAAVSVRRRRARAGE
jgi:VanZ family protein